MRNTICNESRFCDSYMLSNKICKTRYIIECNNDYKVQSPLTPSRYMVRNIRFAEISQQNTYIKMISTRGRSIYTDPTTRVRVRFVRTLGLFIRGDNILLPTPCASKMWGSRVYTCGEAEERVYLSLSPGRSPRRTERNGGGHIDV